MIFQTQNEIDCIVYNTGLSDTNSIYHEACFILILIIRAFILCFTQDRGIKLLQSVKPRPSGSNSEDEDEGSSAAISQLSLDGLGSQEATGAQVFLDEQGSLHWPVLFLYPEHQQTDFISAFSEKDW